MDKYQIIGPVYGVMSRLYGGTAFKRCKRSMINTIEPGQKILFAGVGHGDDAIHAAKQGAEVTVVELSDSMAKKFRKNCENKNIAHQIEIVQDDIMNVKNDVTYDVVIANFFLNIFDLETMRSVLAHLSLLVKPEGALIIGDFARPKENNVLTASIKHGYWYLANSVFWVFADNPIHPIYDYPAEMKELGFTRQKIQYTSLLGMNLFCSVHARKA